MVTSTSRGVRRATVHVESLQRREVMTQRELRELPRGRASAFTGPPPDPLRAPTAGHPLRDESVRSGADG